jgi:hypothetical protein
MPQGANSHSEEFYLTFALGWKDQRDFKKDGWHPPRLGGSGRHSSGQDDLMLKWGFF